MNVFNIGSRSPARFCTIQTAMFDLRIFSLCGVRCCWPALLTVFAILLAGCAKKEVASPPPPEVEITAVTRQTVPLYTEWVATLDSYVNAQIQPQVTGYRTAQKYSEGTAVHKGELLFEIDPKPFDAALRQSKGQLAEAEAQLGKTKLDVALGQGKRDSTGTVG